MADWQSRYRRILVPIRVIPSLAAGLLVIACAGQDRATPEVTGLDLGRLTSEELNFYRQVLQKELAPCGGRETLEVSLRKGTCPLSRFAAKFVAFRVEQDDTPDEISERYIARYGVSGQQEIDVEGAPTLGPETAPVTIVVFSDFQCPFCARAAETLRGLVEEGDGDYRLVFLNFPIASHRMAGPAAVAGLAAHRQGLFWQLHDILFEHRTRLNNDLILRLAEEAGLDLDQFREDVLDPALETQIHSERDRAAQLGVTGTPAVFINGRRFNENLARLETALQEEVVRVRIGREAPATTPAPSKATNDGN